MKHALVTGGDGFIGKRLCEELYRNDYAVFVYGLKRPPDFEFPYFEGDIRNKDALAAAVEESDADVIFHLAGILGTELLDNPQNAVDINISGSLNVFEMASIYGRRAINIGLIPDWLNPYMITKKTAAEFGQKIYHRVRRADIATLEFSHVYGPGQALRPYTKAIPHFISRALKGEPLIVFGEGQKHMDCLYVDDAAAVLRLAGESSSISGQIVQAGNGEAIRVADLARKIISMTGSKSIIEHRPMRPGEPPDEEYEDFTGVNLAGLRQHVDWEPAVNLDEGLGRTIEWYRENLQPE